MTVGAHRQGLLSGGPVPAGGRHAFDRFESLRFASVIDGVEAFTALIRSRQAPSA